MANTIEVVMARRELVAVVSAAHDILEIYESDRELREDDPEFMQALSDGLCTLDGVLGWDDPVESPASER